MTQPKIEGVGHGKPVMPFGSDGTDWYAILIDALGRLQVDVVSTALGSDAATETTLAAIKTAVQLIDDLRAALGSVNTDDLQVDVKTYPGSNALGNFPFGYYDRYMEYGSDLNAAAGGVQKLLSVVPAGEIWVITAAHGYNNTQISRVLIRVGDGTDFIELQDATPSAIGVRTLWSGNVVLKAGDRVYVWFLTTSLGDDLYWGASGYKMKVA